MENPVLNARERFCKGCAYVLLCGAFTLAEYPVARKECIHLDHTHTETQSGPARIIISGVTTSATTDGSAFLRML